MWMRSSSRINITEADSEASKLFVVGVSSLNAITDEICQLLDAKAHLVNIGIHSAEIEVGLRQLFKRLSWECLYDVQLGSKLRIRRSAAYEGYSVNGSINQDYIKG